MKQILQFQERSTRTDPGNKCLVYAKRDITRLSLEKFMLQATRVVNGKDHHQLPQIPSVDGLVRSYVPGNRFFTGIKRYWPSPVRDGEGTWPSGISVNGICERGVCPRSRTSWNHLQCGVTRWDQVVANGTNSMAIHISN
ncbi:unnamed protein product [Rhizoctonia solani]|uniref:Uncharacterized protein n=1 Tax=Rhizoctonia solani TaxID=456999 RepID=A0A8H3CZR7_9AGAM|nr:unnamed protein product [Rhizoctonia solani]